MMKRAQFLALALACLTAPVAADPLFDMGGVKLYVVQPQSVTLAPGGPSRTIRLQGDGLEQFNTIQFIQNDKMIHSVTGSYHSISRGIGELKLQAAADAGPGSYRMTLVTRSGSVRPPIEVTVGAPK